MTVTLPLWALAAFAVGGALMVSAATTLIGRSRNDRPIAERKPRIGLASTESLTKVVVGRGRAPKYPPAPAAQDPHARKDSASAVDRGRRDRLFRVTEALASGGFSLLHRYAARKGDK